MLLRSALILVLLHLISSFNLFARTIVATPNGVMLPYTGLDDTERHFLSFDESGKFLNEKSLKNDEGFQYWLSAVTDDSHIWETIYENDGSWCVRTTIINEYDQSLNLLRSKSLQDLWEVRITEDGEIFVSNTRNSPVQIFSFDLDKGLLQEFTSIDLMEVPVPNSSEPHIDWTIDTQKRISVLLGYGSVGYVRSYTPEGILIWEQRVEAYPKTGVAYMKSIHTDKYGNVYAVHSSNFPNFSRANDGSVTKINPLGEIEFQILEDINRPNTIAISSEGNIFVSSDVTSEVLKYSSNGSFLLKWDTGSPRFGESWIEKQKREDLAREVNNNSQTNDLVTAFAYADWRKSKEIKKWLVKRGPSVLPDVFNSILLFDQHSLMEEFLESYPNETQKFLVAQFSTTTREGRDRLLWFFENHLDLVSTEMRTGLEQDASSSDSEIKTKARSILARKEWTEKLCKLYFEELRSNAEIDRYFSEAISGSLNEFIFLMDTESKSSIETFRKKATDLVLESFHNYSWSWRNKSLDDSTKEILQRWADSDDSALAATAVYILAATGDMKYLPAVNDAVNNGVLSKFHYFDTLRNLSERNSGNLEPYLTNFIDVFIKPDKDGWLFTNLGEIKLPRVSELLVEKMEKGEIPSEEIDNAFQTLSTQVSTHVIDHKQVLQILNQSAIHKHNDVEKYFSFLSDVDERFPNDPEIGNIIRTNLIPLLSNDNSPMISQAIAVIGPRFTTNDVPLLLSVAQKSKMGICSDPSYEAVYQLGEIAYDQPVVQKFLISLLPDDRYTLAAAAGLAKIKYPAALDLVIELGLKNVYRAYAECEAYLPLILPYGEVAEEKLLNLLNYPNESTQLSAKYILAKMNSSKGHQIVLKELQDFVQGKKELYEISLESLLYFGENPWPVVIANSTCKQLEILPQIDEGLQDTEATRLEQMFLEERDVHKAQKIACLIKSIFGSEVGSRISQTIQKSNLSPEIKNLLPVDYW